MKKKERSINNIADQPDKCSYINDLECLNDKLEEIEVSREQWLNKTFAYYRYEIDSIWLANHNSTIEEQRSWCGWESDR